MKRSGKLTRVKVSADGAGVVSPAGVGLLRELAEYTGLVDGVTAALIDTYKGVPFHAPGRVFCDLAVAIADGADAVSGITVLGDREELFGPVASMPTTGLAQLTPVVLAPSGLSSALIAWRVGRRVRW